MDNESDSNGSLIHMIMSRSEFFLLITSGMKHKNMFGGFYCISYINIFYKLTEFYYHQSPTLA